MALNIDAIQTAASVLASLRDQRADVQASLDKARNDLADAQRRIDSFTAALAALPEQVEVQKVAIETALSAYDNEQQTPAVV